MVTRRTTTRRSGLFTLIALASASCEPPCRKSSHSHDHARQCEGAHDQPPGRMVARVDVFAAHQRAYHKWKTNFNRNGAASIQCLSRGPIP